MNEITHNLSQVQYIRDFAFILLITIPFFIFYIVYACIYFTKKDPYVKQEGKGLSRFLLSTIFLMFGLILFDLMMECYSAYATQLLTYENSTFKELIKESLILVNACKQYRQVPISILINGMIFCTAIYTGTEGIIASIKTLRIEQGLAVELPALKRKRLSVMFLIWCYLSIIATIYQFLVGSDSVEFDLSSFYLGLIINFIILFLAERSPNALEDVSITRTIKIKEDGKIVPYEAPVKEYSQEDVANNESVLAADKISETSNNILKNKNDAEQAENYDIEDDETILEETNTSEEL